MMIMYRHQVVRSAGIERWTKDFHSVLRSILKRRKDTTDGVDVDANEDDGEDEDNYDSQDDEDDETRAELISRLVITAAARSLFRDSKRSREGPHAANFPSFRHPSWTWKSKSLQWCELA